MKLETQNSIEMYRAIPERWLTNTTYLSAYMFRPQIFDWWRLQTANASAQKLRLRGSRPIRKCSSSIREVCSVHASSCCIRETLGLSAPVPLFLPHTRRPLSVGKNESVHRGCSFVCRCIIVCVHHLPMYHRLRPSSADVSSATDVQAHQRAPHIPCNNSRCCQWTPHLPFS